jgi:putative resolvase
MEAQGRRMEAVFPDETKDDLVNDFVRIITSMAARIDGRGGSRRKAERMKQRVEQVMKAEDEP